MQSELEVVTEAIYDALANHHRINWSQAEDAAIAALASVSAPVVPDDVRRLVIAARNVAFDVSRTSDGALKELDAASEAFASRVSWDDEPPAEPYPHQPGSPQFDGAEAYRAHLNSPMCEDCQPAGYPTDKTRCAPCPRRAASVSAPPGWQPKDDAK